MDAIVVQQQQQQQQQDGAAAQSKYVIVCEPFLTTLDYGKKSRLLNRLCAPMQDAMQVLRIAVDAPKLVVYGENSGTWLVGENEWRLALTASSTTAGMVYIILSHPISFWYNFFKSIFYYRELGKFGFMNTLQRSIFRMKSRDMLRNYTSTFSEISRRYNAWVVAGSILLPDLDVSGDGSVRFRQNSSSLYNLSLAFDPQGKACGISRKSHLVDGEEFLDSYRPEITQDLEAGEIGQVFESEVGRVAFPICADSWHVDTYERLKPFRPDIVAVPSFVFAETASPAAARAVWTATWKGYYKNDVVPLDIQLSDVNGICEWRAWSKYSCNSRAVGCGAAIAVGAFGRSHVWNLVSTGYGYVSSSKGEILRDNLCGKEFPDPTMRPPNSYLEETDLHDHWVAYKL